MPAARVGYWSEPVTRPGQMGPTRRTAGLDPAQKKKKKSLLGLGFRPI